MATLQWSLTASSKAPDYLLEEYSAPLYNSPGRPLLYMAISHSKSTKPGWEHDWYSLHLCLAPTPDTTFGGGPGYGDSDDHSQGAWASCEDHSNNLFLGEGDSVEELQALAEEQRKFLALALQG